jgi:hypothetical protein
MGRWQKIKNIYGLGLIFVTLLVKSFFVYEPSKLKKNSFFKIGQQQNNALGCFYIFKI